MNITKSQLKEIINEEIEELDSPLLKAIQKLTDKIDDLDISIDYLSSAVTGDSAISIGTSQDSLGRLAPARSGNRRMNEIEKIVKQEIESILSEKEKYKKSFYKSKEKRADHLIDKGVPEDVAYGVADKQMSKAGKKKKK